MHTVTMTIEEARSFLVSYHMINTKNQPKNKQGVMEVFQKLQSVQYDPLDVVGKNSDLVLQARIQNYRKKYLQEVLYQDRDLIDGWDKMMCIYPTVDFPYFSYVRNHRGNDAIRTLEYRASIDALEFKEEIINEIKNNGPKYSSEINLGEKKELKWGHLKPSSATLDYLFHTGELGIRTKRNTQKQYDLMENLIGDLANMTNPLKTSQDFLEWYLLRRVSSLGMTSFKSGVMWSGYLIEVKEERMKCVETLYQSGILTKVIVDGISDPLYVKTDSLTTPNEIKKSVTFIAPLDNLIWDRQLVKDLFGFDYTWEVYTPLSKRKYGYYVLPILYGNRFVGRIEFEQHRNSDPLAIKNVWYEQDFKKTKAFETAFAKALDQFRAYLTK